MKIKVKDLKNLMKFLENEEKLNCSSVEEKETWNKLSIDISELKESIEEGVLANVLKAKMTFTITQANPYNSKKIAKSHEIFIETFDIAENRPPTFKKITTHGPEDP